MTKSLKFLEFDVTLIGTDLYQQPIIQIPYEIYRCYNLCKPIYHEPESNRRGYLEIFYPSHQNVIFGKILKGKYPYRPDIIDVRTHTKRQNPKNISDMEPQIGYFLFKIDNVNVKNNIIEGRALIQIKYNTYFKTLLHKLLECSISNQKDDKNNRENEEENSSKNTKKNIKIQLKEVLDNDIINDLIGNAERILKLEIEGLDIQLPPAFEPYSKIRDGSTKNILIFKPEIRGGTLDKTFIRYILDLFKTKKLPAGRIRIETINEGNRSIINVETLQKTLIINAKVDEDLGLISEQNLFSEMDKMLSYLGESYLGDRV